MPSSGELTLHFKDSLPSEILRQRKFTCFNASFLITWKI